MLDGLAFRALAIAAIVLAPTAAATVRIDTPVGGAVVADRFEDDCSNGPVVACTSGIGGFGEPPGAWRVDAYESVSHVGVAVHPDRERFPGAGFWPERSVRVSLADLAVPNAVAPVVVAAIAAAPASPAPGLVAAHADSREIVIDSVELSAANGSIEPRRHVFRWNDSGVGYHRIVPPYELSYTDSDELARIAATRACRYGGVGCEPPGSGGVADLARAHTPTIVVGFGVHGAAVGTAPEALESATSRAIAAASGGAIAARGSGCCGAPTAPFGRAAPTVPLAAAREPSAPKPPTVPGTARLATPPSALAAASEETRPIAGAVGAAPPAALAMGALLSWLLAVFTRQLDRNGVLGQETRSRLLDLVRAEPGIRPAQAARRLGVHRRCVKYHVRLLDDEDALIVVRARRSVHLFIPGAQPRRDAAPAWAAVSHPVAARVLEAVRGASAGLTRGEVQALVAAPASTVNFHVVRLKSAGIVREDGGRLLADAGAAPA